MLEYQLNQNYATAHELDPAMLSTRSRPDAANAHESLDYTIRPKTFIPTALSRLFISTTCVPSIPVLSRYQSSSIIPPNGAMTLVKLVRTSGREKDVPPFERF